MKIELKDKDQKHISKKIKEFSVDLEKLFEKYGFFYDGIGLDLVNGNYNMFYHPKI